MYWDESEDLKARRYWEADDVHTTTSKIMYQRSSRFEQRCFEWAKSLSYLPESLRSTQVWTFACYLGYPPTSWTFAKLGFHFPVHLSGRMVGRVDSHVTSDLA